MEMSLADQELREEAIVCDDIEVSTFLPLILICIHSRVLKS